MEQIGLISGFSLETFSGRARTVEVDDCGEFRTRNRINWPCGREKMGKRDRRKGARSQM